MNTAPPHSAALVSQGRSVVLECLPRVSKGLGLVSGPHGHEEYHLTVSPSYRIRSPEQNEGRVQCSPPWSESIQTGDPG